MYMDQKVFLGKEQNKMTKLRTTIGWHGMVTISLLMPLALPLLLSFHFVARFFS